jgi:hypothetical protein
MMPILGSAPCAFDMIEEKTERTKINRATFLYITSQSEFIQAVKIADF